MDADRWQRLQTLFDAAVELPPKQRADFLGRECSDDPALRERVAALVESSEAAGSFIERTVSSVAPPVEPRIGAYRIV